MDQLIQVMGSLLILAAFAAAQRGAFSQNSRSYLVLNLIVNDHEKSPVSIMEIPHLGVSGISAGWVAGVERVHADARAS